MCPYCYGLRNGRKINFEAEKCYGCQASITMLAHWADDCRLCLIASAANAAWLLPPFSLSLTCCCSAMPLYECRAKWCDRTLSPVIKYVYNTLKYVDCSFLRNQTV